MTTEFETGRIAAVRSLSPGIRNLTIAAESLKGVTCEPGADVEVRVRSADGLMHERRYSAWMSSAAAGTVDVCVVLHGLGPGSRWAAHAVAGDAVEVRRSRALPIAVDRNAESHMFIGDETSIAATEAIVRALSSSAIVRSCFEVATADRRWPPRELLRPDCVQWIDRAGRPGAALIDCLGQERLSPAERTTAYVTGEAWLCAMVHTHLVRRSGFHPGTVRAMPYWKVRPGSL